MAELKSLAKDTAIYGASSIIGKFLNYFLVPIYTFSLPAASGGYGVITKIIDGRGRIAPVFAVVSGLPQSYCRADGV